MEVRKEIEGMLPKKEGTMSEKHYIKSLEGLSIATKNECIKQNLGRIRLTNNRVEIYNAALSDLADALTKRVVGVDRIMTFLWDVDVPKPENISNDSFVKALASALHSKYIILERGEK